MDESSPSPAKPRRRRWLSYSLRTLLLLTTAAAVALGVLVNGAQRQRRAVAAIGALGGQLRYDFESDATRPSGDLPGPDWLCRTLGVDYFANVVGVQFPANTSDGGLSHLSELTNLKLLYLNDTKVSDAGLANLGGPMTLELLKLDGTQVTDAGCDALKQVLPNCVIAR